MCSKEINSHSIISLENRAVAAHELFGIEARVVVPTVLVESVNNSHLGLAEVEIENCEVFDNTIHFATLGNDCGGSLESPSKQDLSWCL